jgi:hypothetical protein
MARVAALRNFRAIGVAARSWQGSSKRPIREGVGGERLRALVLPDAREEDAPLGQPP